MTTESIVTKTRRQLADAAKAYQWDKVLELLNQHPHLVNSTRPGGTSLYTPLHQAANGNAPIPVVERLLALGASTTAATAKGERAIDIAQAKAHHLIKLLQPMAEPSLTRFPSDVDTAELVCALRFQGYEYTKSTGDDFSALIDSVVKERVLYADQNQNFAAFFGLQRFLYKWGGEHHTKYSGEHMAFDFLFLYLYRLEPEQRFCDLSYTKQWQHVYAPWAESIAGYIRQSMRRIGSGPKIDI
jgi:hypothetical protein